MDLKYFIALSLINIPLSLKSKLYLSFTNKLDLLFTNIREIKLYLKNNNLIDHINPKYLDKIIAFNSWDKVKSIINYAKNNFYSLITPDDLSYPKLLMEINDFPIILYCKGNTSLLNSSCVSIVGSRKYSTYAKLLVSKLVPKLKNYTIVSGMAIGVDSLAHRAALSSKLKTIAVLGTGVDIVYPQSNKTLYNEIVLNDGLIVSEFAFKENAKPGNFPIRNRIVAGLSKRVLVVEARLKSGSLITARLAMEYNRDVYAVPGSVFWENSIGTNWLIKEGANILTSSEDLIIS